MLCQHYSLVDMQEVVLARTAVVAVVVVVAAVVAVVAVAAFVE